LPENQQQALRFIPKMKNRKILHKFYLQMWHKKWGQVTIPPEIKVLYGGALVKKACLCRTISTEEKDKPVGRRII